MSGLRGPANRPPRVVAAMALALTLSACFPDKIRPSAPGANRACLDDHPRFADAWDCLRARLVGGPQTGRSGFLAEGDLLAEQVRAGQISEAQGRARLSAGVAREIGN